MPKNILIICDSLLLEQTAYNLKSTSSHDITIIKSDDLEENLSEYDILWSFHCRKILKEHTICQLPCINVHPGLNPFNRGMFPHVFSILNGLPTGCTIHYIDEKIDSGNIIIQQEVPILDSDTSEEISHRITREEISLIENHFDRISSELPRGNKPESSGNINYLKDFKNLCELDLTEVDTLENHINLLRALSHGEYKNAFFLDGDEKVYISVKLTDG